MKRILLLTAIAVGWASVGSAAEFFGVGVERLRSFWTASADSEVIIGRYRTPEVQGLFRWSAETGTIRLGSVPGARYIGGILSGDGGTIIATFRDDAGKDLRYRWTQSDGFVPIDPAGRPSSLSLDGATGVGVTQNGTERAILWDANSISETIDMREPTLGKSWANDMTPDRSVVVGWMTDTSAPDDAQAFRWTRDQGMVGLGDLPGGRFFSEPAAISADGRVVVGHSISAASGVFAEAFRWTAETGMVALQVPPDASILTSGAADVSGDGSLIVGSIVRDDSIGAAFFWDANHGMRLATDVLANEYGLGTQLAGWTLLSANYISEDGQTIIGGGTNPNGQADIWVAHIPEPSALVLAMVGVFTLAVARRAVYPLLPHRTRA
jgi:uncharacterized membrane protein